MAMDDDSNDITSQLARTKNHHTPGTPKSALQVEMEEWLYPEGGRVAFREIATLAFRINEGKRLSGCVGPTVSMGLVSEMLRHGMDWNGGFTIKPIRINQSWRAPLGRVLQVLEPDLDGKVELTSQRPEGEPLFWFDPRACPWFKDYKAMGLFGWAEQKMSVADLGREVMALPPREWPVGLSGLLPVGGGVDFGVPALAAVFYAGVGALGPWVIVQQKSMGSMWAVTVRSTVLVDGYGRAVEHETLGGTVAEALARAWYIIKKRP